MKMLKERLEHFRALKRTCAIPVSVNQVQKKVFSEANVFNTTHTLQYTCKITSFNWKTLEDLYNLRMWQKVVSCVCVTSECQ
jgi:hypothetical protein